MPSLESLPHHAVIRAYFHGGEGAKYDDYIKEVWVDEKGKTIYHWMALESWGYDGPSLELNHELVEKYDRLEVTSMPLESPVPLTIGTIIIGEPGDEKSPQEPRDEGWGMHPHIIIDEVPPGLMYAASAMRVPQPGEVMSIQLTTMPDSAMNTLIGNIHDQNIARRRLEN